MKKQFLSLLSFFPFLVSAQAPSGYYEAARNKNGLALKIALHHMIKNHNSKPYSYLWTAFQTTDKKPNGKVWDIYSDVPDGIPPYEYTFTSDQCGNYNSEGDCYNREHSWPQSYFNNQSPMVSDLFHIYPTDGYVNGKRSNYAFGLVSSSNPWISENGSKLGSSNSVINYQGIVFEPIDDYKGDLARTYFYMSTRYYSEDAGWASWAMAVGADLKPWAVALLLAWHQQDSVSQKEMDRNEAIYAIQQNRNPFIDHPEYAECIWGTRNCISTGIIEPGKYERATISIYPNPTSEKINIDWEITNQNEKISLDLFNIQGKILYHKDFQENSKQVQIDLSEYAPGIYWLKWKSQTWIQVKKVVLF